MRGDLNRLFTTLRSRVCNRFDTRFGALFGVEAKAVTDTENDFSLEA